MCIKCIMPGLEHFLPACFKVFNLSFFYIFSKLCKTIFWRGIIKMAVWNYQIDSSLPVSCVFLGNSFHSFIRFILFSFHNLICCTYVRNLDNFRQHHISMRTVCKFAPIIFCKDVFYRFMLRRNTVIYLFKCMV